MRAKYIVIEVGGFEQPFVFSELSQHADVARALAGVSAVVGAGFCYIDDNRYICYGESISCNVKSRGAADSKILNRLLGVDND